MFIMFNVYNYNVSYIVVISIVTGIDVFDTAVIKKETKIH